MENFFSSLIEITYKAAGVYFLNVITGRKKFHSKID